MNIFKMKMADDGDTQRVLNEKQEQRANYD